ncbi:MAG: C39 family peptidase [Candidatus Marinimicrobia bacterium]|nr:C39 family peptidase [Candidatus Neomarinimicrobiota bacterium]
MKNLKRILYLLLLISITFAKQSMPTELLFVKWGKEDHNLSYRLDPSAKFGPQSFSVKNSFVKILDPVNNKVKIFKNGQLQHIKYAPSNAKDFAILEDKSIFFLIGNDIYKYSDHEIMQEYTNYDQSSLIKDIEIKNENILIHSYDGSKKILRDDQTESLNKNVSIKSSYDVSLKSKRLALFTYNNENITIKCKLTQEDNNLGSVKFIGEDKHQRLYFDVNLIEQKVPLKVNRKIWITDHQGKKFGIINIPAHSFTTIHDDIEFNPEGIIFHMLSSKDGIHVFKWKIPKDINNTFRGYYPERFQKRLHFNNFNWKLEKTLKRHYKEQSKPVSRDKVLEIANNYVRHEWNCTEDNITDGIVTAPDGYRIDTPDWIEVGQNQNIPYKWGGFNTITEFDNGIKNGKYAGDTCWVQKNEGSAYARGVDCSGFVSRCWQLSTHYSTNSMSNWNKIYTYSSWDSLKQGDAILSPGHHVILFVQKKNNGSYKCIESAGHKTNWKVDYTIRSLSELVEYKPVYYENLTSRIPDLVYPSDSSIARDSSPKFIWSNVENAEYYGLYISEPPYGSENLVFDSEKTYGQIHDTTFNKLPVNILEENIKYHWNVRAHFTDGWGYFSESNSFYYISQDSVYVPTDFTTIQQAIDTLNEGNTVIIEGGTYNENIIIDKELTLRGDDNADSILIEAANSGSHVVQLYSDNVEIKGLTFKGATAENKAGIAGDGVQHCKIFNNNFIDNYVGIVLNSSSINTIRDNVSRSNSKASIVLANSNTNTIKNNICSGGQYGIYIREESADCATNEILKQTDANNSSEITRNLHRLRDDKLKKYYKRLYYQYSPFFSEIFRKNLPLSIEALKILNKYNGAIKCFLNGSIEEDDIDRKDIDQILSFTNNLQTEIKHHKNKIDKVHYSKIKNSINEFENQFKSFKGKKLSRSLDNSTYIRSKSIQNENSLSKKSRINISNKNVIYLNKFINNSQNAYSETSNLWSSTIELPYRIEDSIYRCRLGNYWDDYRGQDENNDGIGDTSYTINSSNIDYYPLSDSSKNYNDYKDICIIDVPFKSQVPPGTWGETQNCGQACALMLFSYYNDTIPKMSGIKEIDEWLNSKYGEPINNYNGSAINTSQITTLAREYAGLTGSYRTNSWTLDDLKQELDKGHPVIVAIIAGYLSNRGYNYDEGHFVIAKGYNENHIICNDPGTQHGNNKYYLNSEFSSAMAGQGGAVVVVLPPPYQKLTLNQFSNQITNNNADEDSYKFVRLTNPDIKNHFKNLLKYILSNNTTEASDEIRELNDLEVGYKLYKIVDPSEIDEPLYGFMETSKPDTDIYKGWGSYLIRPNSDGNIIYQAPHINYETYTKDIALNAFIDNKNAKAIFFNGADRRSNDDSDDDDGANSDVAHDTENLFHLFTNYLANQGVNEGGYWFIQIHGAEDREEEPSITASTGAEHPNENINSELIKIDNIVDSDGNVTMGVCGWEEGSADYKDGDYKLAATKNVQGNLLESLGLRKSFMHFELERSARDEYNEQTGPGYNGINCLLSAIKSTLGSRPVNETLVITNNNIPIKYILSHNYPNPFNPKTTIEFSLPKSGHVKLNIYNITGQMVDLLINKEMSPGHYSITWNASELPSGIYFYRIKAGNFTDVKKCILIK